MESERSKPVSPAGKKATVTVEDHLRSALGATENEAVEYHVHTALQMLVGND